MSINLARRQAAAAAIETLRLQVSAESILTEPRAKRLEIAVALHKLANALREHPHLQSFMDAAFALADAVHPSRGRPSKQGILDERRPKRPRGAPRILDESYLDEFTKRVNVEIKRRMTSQVIVEAGSTGRKVRTITDKDRTAKAVIRDLGRKTGVNELDVARATQRYHRIKKR